MINFDVNFKINQILNDYCFIVVFHNTTVFCLNINQTIYYNLINLNHLYMKISIKYNNR